MILANKILHIVLAAVWFGHKLLIPRDLRRSLHHEDQGLIERMRTAERLGIAAGLGTLLSGVALILLTTGFADAPPRIYLGLGAVVAMFVVGARVARPAWRQIETGLGSGDLPAAASRLGSFNGALRLEGLLWILALTTMVI